MKNNGFLYALILGALLLQGCGGDSFLGDDKSLDMLEPEPVPIDYGTIDRPSESARVITTDNRFIYDSGNNQVRLRGVDLQYNIAPDEWLTAIDAIKSTGANIVRIFLDANTSAEQLQAALDKVVENKMVAIVTMTDNNGDIYCGTDYQYIKNEVVVKYWFDKWHSVIVQDKYQPHLMISPAHGWGPKNIFDEKNRGYDSYIDTYKAIIRIFRNAGFKVPLVIDAPACGTDFNAFADNRGQQLFVADTEDNIVVSARAAGKAWNSVTKTTNAIVKVNLENIPFFISGFYGSEVDEFDHLDAISKSMGDQGVRVSLNWQSDADSGAYAIPLPEIMNLTEGSTSVDVFVDRPLQEFGPVSEGANEQIPYGALTVDTFIRDADGNELRVGSTAASEMRELAWNTLWGEIPAAGEIEINNLLTGDSFDLSAVTHIGVSIAANGKSPDIDGDVQMDNLRVFPAVPPMLEQTFSDSVEGWAPSEWQPPQVSLAELSNVDGVLSVLPKPNSMQLNLGADALGALDFSKEMKISFDAKIPAEYPSDMYLKFFVMFGDSWTWFESSFVVSKFDEWSNLSSTVNWVSLAKQKFLDEDNSLTEDQAQSKAEALVTSPGAAGIAAGQFPSSFDAPILIDNFIVEDVNARPTKIVTTTQFEETFSEEGGIWVDTWGGAATLSADNGWLTVSVPSHTPTGLINYSGISSVQEINMGGSLRFSFDIAVDTEFDNPDALFKLIIQSSTWQHFEVAVVPASELTAGEWHSFEFEADENDFPEGFIRTGLPRYFGIQYAEINNGGDFALDNFKIIGDTVVDDLKPIYEADFAEANEVAAFSAQSGGGALDVTAVEAAKTADWRIVPFGWTATTWFGAENDALGLDISNSIDSADLTVRGEEIVNGEDGIANTASVVSF